MTECPYCHDRLVKHEELHAVSGLLFCSKECAIGYFMRDIIRNAHEAAENIYDDGAEIILSSEVLADEQGN